MLTPEQRSHFEVFGFLLFRQAIGARELDEIVAAGEEIWDAAKGTDEETPQDIHCAPFLERSEYLAGLPEDDRFYGPIGELAGPGFTWGGSEGAWCRPGVDQTHPWHSDRVGEIELSYLRLKYMIYLQPMRKEEGALRVLPGSHRSALHRDLARRLQPSQGRLAENEFGLAGDQVPCHALEVEPGDVVLFNHYLFHSVYGKQEGRRYIAMKYAAPPRSEAQYEALVRHGQDAVRLHDTFRHSERPRIRAMVEPLLAWERRLALANEA